MFKLDDGIPKEEDGFLAETLGTKETFELRQERVCSIAQIHIFNVFFFL
jgi:hypothetical protein